jgi:hypothetical protein
VSLFYLSILILDFSLSTCLSLSCWAVEMPTLEEYLKSRLIEILSSMDTVGKEANPSQGPTSEENNAKSAQQMSNEMVDSEPLDILHVVVVDAEIDTIATLSSMKMTSPRPIRIFFQSNLRVSEADFEWRIEKIAIDI